MQATHRLHDHADVGIAEDAGEVVRHHAAQRVRVKGAQVQHALDAERFAAEAARDVRAVARDDLVHAVADGAEAEYSNINHRFLHTFLKTDAAAAPQCGRASVHGFASNAPPVRPVRI